MDRPLLIQWIVSVLDYHERKLHSKVHIRKHSLEDVSFHFPLIRCETYRYNNLKVHVEASVLEELPNPPSIIEKRVASTVNDTIADVTLTVNGNQFKVHKALLSDQSSVFANMFETEPEKSLFEVANVNLDVFERFLCYFYTSTVDDLNTFAEKLLTLANTYQVESLKTICGTHLSVSITPETCITLLLLSHECQVGQLKDACLKYFSKHYKKISTTTEWAKLIDINLKLMPILHQIMAAKK